MDSFKQQYKDAKGKTNSMYIYILYECSNEKLKDHVEKQLETIERVSDSFKRKLFSSRYFLIKNMIEQYKELHVYNSILFVNDDLDEHPLTDFNKKLLNHFDHQAITFIYDD